MQTEKKYLKLNDIDCYKVSFHLSNYVWDVVYLKWDYFAKRTIGRQFVDAIDSISANIAEGFGRYHKKEKIHFYRIASGSLKECLNWNEKAKVRNLISTEQYEHIYKELNRLPKSINSLIRFTNEKLKI